MRIHVGDGLLEHLAVPGVTGGLQLLSQAFAGQKQPVALSVELLILGRRSCVDGVAPLCHFLLLFDGLALPATGHVGILPRDRIATALRSANAYREIDVLKNRLAQEKRYLENEVRSANRPEDIIGNSAALTMPLLSRIFGHEKGAFTGAISQKLGRLELADKGTLLLDEIGEMPKAIARY